MPCCECLTRYRKPGANTGARKRRRQETRKAPVTPQGGIHNMKRVVAFIVIACVMCVGLTTAFAHDGSHHANWIGYGTKRAVATPVACTVEGCTRTYNHYHGSTLCYGHHNDDGTCWEPCSVSGCEYNGYHTHNGSGYYGHCSDTGSTWDACSVSGCTQSGYHTHDGVSYCGHHWTASSGSSSGSSSSSSDDYYTPSYGGHHSSGHHGGCHGGGC